MMVDFKLANILFELEDHLSSYPETLYRSADNVRYLREDNSLHFEGTIDLLTYFNSISCVKWKKYTGLDRAFVHIELAGDTCDVEIKAIRVEDAARLPMTPLTSELPLERTIETVSTGITRHVSQSADYVSLDLELPLDAWAIAGAVIRSSGTTKIRNAFWYARVDEARIRPVKLALATTTFKKEAYVVPNIEAIKLKIGTSSDAVASAFHMFVIDNGRTLDASALSDDLVTVIPNANVGGAGGFARGMMAALEPEGHFTHVLLMDDDVRMSPESIMRTFNLLSLVNDRYRDAFVNGAMLQLNRPDIQYEDVAHVLDDGRYDRCKGTLRITSVADIALNEVTDVEVPDAYGAWWYSCIPLNIVREKGLPLPVFVRCDDVEYGMRCNPTYMCMNGLCVWHEAFDGRYRAAVDAYQYVRNFMIMMACDDKSNETLFFLRTERMFVVSLRGMAYDLADLIVSAFEDYLKGPEFLMAADGEAILKANSAKNERLLPLSDALEQAGKRYPELTGKLEGFSPDLEVLHDTRDSPLFMKAFRALPYDRHRLPDWLLRDEPATIFYGPGYATSHKQIGTRVLVACDRDGKSAHVRVLDRSRYKELLGRWKKMKRAYKRNGKALKQAYKRAMPSLTGMHFWEQYLGLRG